MSELPVAKFPKYLSPSSLMQIESRPNTFYITRMAPNPRPYEPQGVAAGVGSAFDAHVKNALLSGGKLSQTEQDVKTIVLADSRRPPSELGRLGQLPLLEVMKCTEVEEQNREECWDAGKRLLQTYKYNGLEDNRYFDWVSVELHQAKMVGGVPIFGKLDAVVKDKESDRNVPFDWKTSGYSTEGGVSPKKGYMKLYDNGLQKGAHKLWAKDIAMNFIDEGWATQGGTYGMYLGLEPPYPVYIDMLVIRPTGIRVARYKGIITKEFDALLRERYAIAWESLHTSPSNPNSFFKRISSVRDFVDMASTQEKWYA